MEVINNHIPAWNFNFLSRDRFKVWLASKIGLKYELKSLYSDFYHRTSTSKPIYNLVIIWSLRVVSSDKNFHRKSTFFTKNRDFWPKISFLTKFPGQNHNFRSKIAILSPKIHFGSKFSNSGKIFRWNFIWWLFSN